MTELTLIQMGDVHGHLIPRPNLRSDGTGRLEGGLSRMATLINEIRRAHPVNLLANAGDTIQGGAEALFTRGQAMVDVIDRFKVDLFAPGNWDYLYGKDRFLELFGEGSGPGGIGCRWGALAANVYHKGTTRTILPARMVILIGGIRVGVVGLSSERAITVGDSFSEGLTFTSDAHELPAHIAALKREQADVIILISEFGLARNVFIAEQNPDINVVLSSDMHEETRRCVVTAAGTLISEVGQDGTRLAQLNLTIENGRITTWDYVLHVVDSALEPDAQIDRLVAQIRRPFVSGPAFVPHPNPINGTTLHRPIDTVVGTTQVGLHRSNFSHQERPAAVSGTSHDFLATAIREVSQTDIGHLRGFRYGSHVSPGPIRLENLYHFMPVGASIARTIIRGKQLRQSIENSADGTFNPEPFSWTGGWLSSYAGVRFTLDVYRGKGERTSAIKVQRNGDSEWRDLDLDATYTFAGYWYPTDPKNVGGIDTSTPVKRVRNGDPSDVDATDLIVEYLAERTLIEEPMRIRLARALPEEIFTNPELQPLHGGR